MPAWKLYYGLLLASANDTAVALAVAAGGSRLRFLKLMNQKARALGLRHTQYRSASGLIDKGNYSTVYDLAMLTRHALLNPRFRSIVATKHKRIWWRKPTGAKLHENHNKLLWRYAGADGVKTGYTRASGPCLVASATRHGIQLIPPCSTHPIITGTRFAFELRLPPPRLIRQVFLPATAPATRPETRPAAQARQPLQPAAVGVHHVDLRLQGSAGRDHDLPPVRGPVVAAVTRGPGSAAAPVGVHDAKLRR